MPNPTPPATATPTASGTPRVRQTADGAWQVIDAAASRHRVVETIAGVGEGRPRGRGRRPRLRRATHHRPDRPAPATRGVGTRVKGLHPEPPRERRSVRDANPGDAAQHGSRQSRARRSGCAAGCGSPTGAHSAANCRRTPPGAAARDAARAQSDGLVELAAGRREHGKLSITTRPPPRTRPDHFLPGGASGKEGWLEGLLALADRHAKRGEEVFIAPAGRSQPRGQTSTPSVTPTRCGSTSTAPDSCTTCGRSSPSAHATS